MNTIGTQSKTPSGDGQSGRHGNGNVDLIEFLSLEVIPRLTPDQVFTHPAHKWQKDGNKWRGGCPWHDSKSGTAFYIHAPSLVWRCPACAIGGGPIQYLHRLRGGVGVSPHGLDFVNIVKELAHMAGVAFPEHRLPTEGAELTRKRETRRVVLESIAILAEEILWSPAGAQARAYLQERGFNGDDLRDLHVGLYGSADPMLQALLSRGFLIEDVLEGGAVWRGMEGYIVFPWCDDAGRPLTLYGKWPTKIPPDGKPKTTALPNPKDADKTAWERTKRSCLYLDRALRAGHQDLVLVEGVTDAALAQVRGDTRVVACVGAQLTRLQVETFARRRIKSVTIALDPDKAGENGIMSCVGSLLPAGIVPFVVPQLPEQMDPDEFVISHGIDAWREHVRKAVHCFRHVAERIVQAHKPLTGWTDKDLTEVTAEAESFARDVPARWANDLEGFFWRTIERETGLSRVARQAEAGTVHEKDDGSAGKPTGPDLHLTDIGNAQRIVRDHGADLRYCFAWKKWLVWEGRRWRIDDTGEVVRRAKATIKKIYDEAMAGIVIVRGSECDRRTKADRLDAVSELLKWAHDSEDARAIGRLLDLARSEPGIPVLPGDLDRDAWLLNCANGTVDLRTGELRPHRREDLLTKLCPTPYVPEAECPRFVKALDGIYARDQELIWFQQTHLGYCLTGDVREQILPIWWGSGANGKTTFQNAILETVGPDYAGNAPVELVMMTRSDQHPTLLADLFGKRLVFAAETGQGRQLNIERLKLLTGGDRVKARRMREDFWEFEPTHKLVVITNHKPEVRDSGHAAWRRLKLIPHTVQFLNPADPQNVGMSIPENLRIDKGLKEALERERLGILDWLVQGCLIWQISGLPLPAKVRAATAEYRDEQDQLAAFLAECCEINVDENTGATPLYMAYKDWCEVRGEHAMTQRRFGDGLKDRGHSKITSNGVKYERLRLRQDRPRPPSRWLT